MDCSSSRFSAAIVEGSKSLNGFAICTHCALPAGNQDKYNFHPNGNVGKNCETGFANIAEAISWYVYRAQRSQLKKWFPAAPVDSDLSFSKWLGITSKNLGPAPWPNAVKLVLTFEQHNK
jgi:hypothetical protein